LLFILIKIIDYVKNSINKSFDFSEMNLSRYDSMSIWVGIYEERNSNYWRLKRPAGLHSNAGISGIFRVFATLPIGIAHGPKRKVIFE